MVEVIGPDTVLTSDGRYRLYGVFVAPEEENCVTEATTRLMQLASGSVRLEAGPVPTDSGGTPIRYMYTQAGDSIDELFISEGIARFSAFDGPHYPWLLITAENARRAGAGCIWENFRQQFPGRTPRPPGAVN